MGSAKETVPGAQRSAVARACSATWHGARSFVRFFEGVLGADKYRVYLEHQARTHPGVPPMSEREFWRDYTDWQEKNPQGRCC
ncbi:hypothetical protein GCM10009628_15970 [Paeniglutamicibacter kerguelensis]|nr:YbdD/YjiX family protein [Paeniglutamicibacter kerguelensis]